MDISKAIAIDTRESGKEQRAEMAASIMQATRSALATEALAANVGRTLEFNASVFEAGKKQVRAYIFTPSGNGTPQTDQLRFEGEVTYQNTGQSTAFNVRCVANCGILRFDQLDSFAFPLPDMPEVGVPLGNGQGLGVSRILGERVPDDHVADISINANEAFYVWGAIAYADIFGDPHETKFCLRFRFIGNVVRTHQVPQHTSAS